MAVMDALKKAPKWAWFTAAGVGVGAAAIKVYNDRDAPEPEPVVAEVIGEPTYAGGGGTPGVIVPPVIIGGGGNTDASAGTLSELYMGGIGQLFSAWQDVGNMYTDFIANGGSAPPSAQQVNTPVVSSPSLPQPSPTPLPLPAPVPAPAPTSSPAPNLPAPVDRCVGEYPNESSHGCYKVACASGSGSRKKGRWHLYKNGREVWVRSTC